ncbi:MAG: hypothetical protein M1821_001038 [Bathelium mastoideum]|nr:MAG: hypothetical protein M1821_001038 [Bathelium mastoideum]
MDLVTQKSSADKRLTSQEGNKIEWTSWNDVPSDVQITTLNTINAQLSLEGIQPINEKILKWRMAQVIKNKTRRTTVQSSDESQTPEPQHGRSALSYDPVRHLDDET